jgi:hypothetical protein
MLTWMIFFVPSDVAYDLPPQEGVHFWFDGNFQVSASKDMVT